MSKLVEHINKPGSEIGDLTIDQPTTHQWLPTDTTPVLSTPVLVGLAIAAATYATGDGGGCIITC